MTVMNTQIFETFADRIARDYKTLNDSLHQMAASGSYFGILTDTNVPDIEIPMIEYADIFDNYIDGDYAATKMSASIYPFTDLITSFENHLKRTDIGRTWDSYCSASGVRVSDYTNQVHYAKHQRYMNARNVFSENPIQMGIVTVGPSGVIFTDKDNFGTGSAKEKADGGNFAAAALEATLMNDISTPLVIDVIGLNEVGESQTIRSNAITGSGYVTVPLLPSGRYVDVTNVEFVSGGSLGNTIIIKTIKERDIYA